MRTIGRIRVSLLIIVMSALPSIVAAQPKPPATEKKPHVTKIHGDTLVDNYFWLREKSNPDVIAHLEAENAYTAAMTADTQPLQQKLYTEMLSHVKQTDVNVPYRLGDYYYYSRTEEGKQYPIYARKKGKLDAAEEITLDLNELAKGLKFLALGSYRVSDDGNLLAYSTDTTGYRQYTLYVKDLRTGALLSEKIERVDTVLWATDNKTLFYVTEDNVTKRSDNFYRHVLGTTTNDLVFHEPDDFMTSAPTGPATRPSSLCRPTARPPRKPAPFRQTSPMTRCALSFPARPITATSSIIAAIVSTSARTTTPETTGL